MDKSTRKLFIVYIFLLMVIIPIIINILMFINIFPVKGDINTWISSLGTFWGAIIGGIISGVITLIGVRMTIQNQKNEEFIRIYPQMMLLGDEITTSLKHFLEEIEEKKQDAFDVVQTVRRYKTLSDNLLTNSTKINGFVYENYKHIHGYFYYFDKYINENSTYNEFRVVEYNLDSSKVEHYKKLIKDSLNIHDQLVLEISNTFFTLTIVDRLPKKHKKQTQKMLQKITE